MKYAYYEKGLLKLNFKIVDNRNDIPYEEEKFYILSDSEYEELVNCDTKYKRELYAYKDRADYYKNEYENMKRAYREEFDMRKQYQTAYTRMQNEKKLKDLEERNKQKQQQTVDFKINDDEIITEGLNIRETKDIEKLRKECMKLIKDNTKLKWQIEVCKEITNRYNNKLKKKRYGKNQKIYIYNESDPDLDGDTELLVLKQEYFFIKGKVDYNYKKEFLIPLPNNSSEEDLIEYIKSNDLNPALARRLKDKNIRLWKAIADSKTENWRLIFISNNDFK